MVGGKVGIPLDHRLRGQFTRRRDLDGCEPAAGGDRHESVREAARIELGLRSFLATGRFGAFTSNFEDLGGLRQLPGLAVQRLMADGYGFGGEGDWKTALLVRAVKVMGEGLPGGTSFMEDYTYHLGPGEPKTVHRLIRRMVRYMDNPDRVPPPIFAGEQASAPPALARDDGDAAPTPQATITPAPHIERLDHVAIAVSDLERALAFYQGLLGFRPLGQIDLPGEDPPRTLAHLDTGRGALALVSGADGKAEAERTRPGPLYVALRVAGLDAIVARLAHAGVAVRSAPVSTGYGVRVAEVADPDGTPIRLIEGDFVYSRR